VEKIVQIVLPGLVSLVDGLNVEVSECEDAAQGLEAFAESQPDPVLLDLYLDQKDGLSVTRQIKAVYPQAKVIIASALEARDGLKLSI
jgi:CheY-like chemotaxis protein